LARLFALAFAAFGSTGCGLLFQTAMGWTSDETTKSRRTTAIDVLAPTDAEVSRKGPDQQVTPISPGMRDNVSWEEEITTATPSYGALLVGALIDGAVSGVLIASGSGGNDAGRAALGVEGILFLAIPELITALIWGTSSPSVKIRRTTPNSDLYAYTARAGDREISHAYIYASQMSRVVLLPKEETVATPVGTFTNVASEAEKETQSGFRSEPPAIVTPATSPEPPPRAPTHTPWSVDVREAEDASQLANAHKLEAALVRSIRGELRAVLEREGVRTVGSNVRSSHILVPRLGRIDGRCVLSAELVDPLSEVILAAATSAGECTEAGLEGMCAEVAATIGSFAK
jgi:hypothetical protein